MHVQQKENVSRGKISLIPDSRAGPPSTSGGASVARAPRSEAGSVAPSVAGSIAPSMRQPRPVHFTHNMDKGVGAHYGQQMDAFLNPVDGIRGQMKRAGVEPKNHIRENRAMLREMADVKAMQKEAQVEAQESRREKEARIRDNARAKAQQTLVDLGAMDISEEGAPPSRGASAGRRSVRPPPSVLAAQAEPAPPPQRHTPGAVPAYLQRRKAEWQATADHAAAREAAMAECPPGTRLVGPEEKARILDKLAEERAKASVELRQLPFVVKTQATQQKKDRLEARLEEIAGAEEAYMREKVFVPADM